MRYSASVIAGSESKQVLAANIEKNRSGCRYDWTVFHFFQKNRWVFFKIGSSFACGMCPPTASGELITEVFHGDRI
jgi:hypothetical protein